MISKFRIGVLVIILNFFASVAMIWGQVENPSLLQMAVPSLNIAPDARGGGISLNLSGLVISFFSVL